MMDRGEICGEACDGAILVELSCGTLLYGGRVNSILGIDQRCDLNVVESFCSAKKCVFLGDLDVVII